MNEAVVEEHNNTQKCINSYNAYNYNLQQQSIAIKHSFRLTKSGLVWLNYLYITNMLLMVLDTCKGWHYHFLLYQV